MLAQTATEVVNQAMPGFHYSSEYDQYYNEEWWLDMKTRLYYHIKKQKYFYYDEKNNFVEYAKPRLIKEALLGHKEQGSESRSRWREGRVCGSRSKRNFPTKQLASV